MATLTPKLTLTSSDTSTDSLLLSVDDSLTVTTPMVDIGRTSVSHSSATTILSASNSTTTYIYAKNIDTTNHVKIYTGADELYGILWPGEFLFVPIIDGEGFKLQANNAACIVEYGYWTKG